MAPPVTRRRFLQTGGVLTVGSLAGCLTGPAQSMQQTLEEIEPVSIDVSQQPSVFPSGPVLRSHLDVDVSELIVRDGVVTSAGGVTLAGQADERPFVLQIAEDGNRDWIQTIQSTNETGAIESLTKLPNGGIIGAGWNDTQGLVVRVSQTGELVWQRTIAPGPDRYRFSQVELQGAGGALLVGDRSGRSDTSDRNSAWLVSLTASGAADWHRFYGNMISSVADAVTVTPNTHLLRVWKQTAVGVENFDAIIAIKQGRQTWSHGYPGARLNTFSVAEQNRYHFSATGTGVSEPTISDSAALFGFRELNGPSVWLRKLSLEGREIDASLSLPMNDWLLAVCNPVASPPVVTRLNWDGGVSESTLFTAESVDTMIRVSPTVVLVVQNDLLRVFDASGNPW